MQQQTTFVGECNLSARMKFSANDFFYFEIWISLIDKSKSETYLRANDNDSLSITTPLENKKKINGLQLK